MIRIANKEDINLINKLGKILYPNFENIFPLNNYIENDRYKILVNQDEIINGFLLIYQNIDCYEIEIIIVSYNDRKKGIATNLLKYFFEHYTKKDDCIFLEVACENKAAINLYTKFGFETINIRKKYYNNMDAYVMKKVIM